MRSPSIRLRARCLQSVRVPTGDAPVSLNVDPSGKYLLAANSQSDNVSVFAIDPKTGEITSAGPPTPTGKTPSSVVTIGKLINATPSN